MEEGTLAIKVFEEQGFRVRNQESGLENDDLVVKTPDVRQFVIDNS